ncbi:MAG: hypothetical protein HZB51_10555 [Chloroflexi bacterium]|nr:hypothetical protein [Chloroflexota bacterium]
MQDSNWNRRNRRRQVLVRRTDVIDEDGNIITRIPTQAEIDRARRAAPDPQVYQEALRVMMATPEIQRRTSYITASMIVSVLGGWLAGQAMKTRAFVFIVDALIFLFSITIVGLLIGLLIGFGILPIETLPVLLIIGTVIVLVVAIVVFIAMMMTTQSPPRRYTAPPPEPPEPVDYVVMDEPRTRTYSYRVNRR